MAGATVRPGDRLLYKYMAGKDGKADGRAVWEAQFSLTVSMHYTSGCKYGDKGVARVATEFTYYAEKRLARSGMEVL